MRDLSAIIEVFDRDPVEASAALHDWFYQLEDAPLSDREGATRELCQHFDCGRPEIVCSVALVAGALVEGGVDPEPVARALVPLLENTLEDAAGIADHLDALTEAAEEAEDAELVCGRLVERDALDAIGDRDPHALIAFAALRHLASAAVTCWSRSPSVLRQVHEDPTIRGYLDRLDGSDRVRWLAILCAVLHDVPFVVLAPQLRRGWAFRLSGCADNGQLMMLLSDPLARDLQAIGAEGRLAEELLAVARGDGPQSLDASFEASWHLYPWQAADPTSLMPRDNVHTWTAPGGSGSHSLPPDFLPASIEPIDGVRVLLLVGPDGPPGAPEPTHVRFTRILNAQRAFDGLAAELTDPDELAPDELAAWHRRIVSSARSAAPS